MSKAVTDEENYSIVCILRKIKMHKLLKCSIVEVVFVKGRHRNQAEIYNKLILVQMRIFKVYGERKNGFLYYYRFSIRYSGRCN